MNAADFQMRVIGFLAEVLECEREVSFRLGKSIDNFKREISEWALEDSDVNTIEYAPKYSPGTVTIKIFGIPDPDGKLEAAVKEAISTAVNAVLDERADPLVKEKQNAAFEAAQKYRNSKPEDSPK